MTPLPPFRIGHGFDLHRLAPGRQLVIGGQPIENAWGCVAHSDGDVVYHSVTDAVLGALGMNDIGQQFPDTDPKWRGADSQIFVASAVEQMQTAGYALGNLDVTIILQRPKLSAYKQAIGQNLASLLRCDHKQVNVKGKTHEHVDAVGKGKAVACHAVVLLTAQRRDLGRPENLSPPQTKAPNS